jgi:hypothetical protein
MRTTGRDERLIICQTLETREHQRMRTRRRMERAQAYILLVFDGEEDKALGIGRQQWLHDSIRWHRRRIGYGGLALLAHLAKVRSSCHGGEEKKTAKRGIGSVREVQ